MSVIVPCRSLFLRTKKSKSCCLVQEWKKVSFEPFRESKKRVRWEIGNGLEKTFKAFFNREKIYFVQSCWLEKFFRSKYSGSIWSLSSRQHSDDTHAHIVNAVTYELVVELASGLDSLHGRSSLLRSSIPVIRCQFSSNEKVSCVPIKFMMRVLQVQVSPIETDTY